jgi:hypothetical protein
MYNSNHIPAYKVVFYSNNPETGNYTKTEKQHEKTPVMRLPYQLKVEPTILHQIKCNALQIIRGNEKFKTNGSFKFFTGLQDTKNLQWFAGNDYEKLKGQKKLSLCLFKFSLDNSRLTVFYFGRFYIDNREARERFINDVIPVLYDRLLLLNTNGEF